MQDIRSTNEAKEIRNAKEREGRTNETEAEKQKRLKQKRKNYKDHPDLYISYQKEWKESDAVQTRNDLKWLNQWLENVLEEMETILSQFDFCKFKIKIHALKENFSKEFHHDLDQLTKTISDLNVELRL